MRTPASTVTVRSRYQVVIPQGVRDRIGVNVGDVLEATAVSGSIVLKPKAISHSEYTKEQRRKIDARLAKSLAEHKQGKSYGPFETHEEMVAFLHERVSAKTAKRRAR